MIYLCVCIYIYIFCVYIGYNYPVVLGAGTQVLAAAALRFAGLASVRRGRGFPRLDTASSNGRPLAGKGKSVRRQEEL